MDKPKGILAPAHLLVLDVVGCILLGVGLAKHFGHVDLIPAALRFDGYGVSFIIGGAVFMLPALAHMTRNAIEQGRAAKERKL